MEADSTPSNPNIQESVPPRMPYPTHQPPPTYAQVVTDPAYHQPYNPNQNAPVPHPTVYQPVQYVVTTTTAPRVMGEAHQSRYNDYMCWSIMSMLFCCLPFGLVALVLTCKTQEANALQDFQSAMSYSKGTFRCNMAALILGASCYVLLFVYMVFLK
ncbi:proline rich transmembrane protein 1B-like [Bufo bufo]|uniref:proline rich transmembrane protein 1B-like n=1 Tax=Bufo bufo TaxID=8384 RepID=UPI001ABDB150|nr:proline rich transmembrane protein 1B-like [Bufo bufo]